MMEEGRCWSFLFVFLIKGTMGKGKPRHDPDKPANQYGGRCWYFEEYIDGTCGCEVHPEIAGDKLKCGGNRHNCVKVEYQKQAIKKEL
jgi:hypothetical protein